MVDINLSKSVRSNLSSLQNTASLMSKTSDRLSTGNKVNSALDNPTNFFTASSLNSRASDLNQLMDSMANGIKTIEAADNGLTAITKTVESMQSTLRQMRQDKSFQTTSLELDTTTTAVKAGAFTIDGKSVATTKLTGLTGAAVATGISASDADADGVTIQVGTNTVENLNITEDMSLADLASLINNNANLKAQGVTASVSDDFKLSINTKDGSRLRVGGAEADAFGIATAADTDATAPAGATFNYRVKTADELVATINTDPALNTTVRAATDNGKLRLENLLTSDEVSIGGLTGTKISGAAAGTGTVPAIGNNTVREDLVNQFNDLRNKLDSLAEDASFNGINLLRGDNLKITFNESGSSSIDVKSKNLTGINSTNLGIDAQAMTIADSDAGIDAQLATLGDSLKQLRSQSGAFGSNLSVVQNRQDFTQKMINTLETGAGNLTLADMNQEAANMMALQTRQSLASSTLSMANAADQNVLQLLR